MRFLSRCAAVPLLLCLMIAAAFAVHAQGDPPRVLLIREFPKPHHENAIPSAAKSAPLYHIALSSMSGKERVLLISGFPSFAALEAEGKVGQRNPSAGAAFDHTLAADGGLIATTDVSHWVYRPDLSLNTRDLVGVRYMEVQLIITKPGRSAQFDEWIKMYVDGYKGVPGYNWTTYQQVFGSNYYAYLFIARYKSLSEVDDAWGVDGSATKAFNSVHGESGLKKLRALWAEVVDSEMTDLYRISPEMSRPTAEVIKAEPGFWSARPASKP